MSDVSKRGRTHSPPATSPGSFTLRDATVADHAALVAFNQAMAQETEHKQLDPHKLGPGVRRVLEDAAVGRYFVAVAADIAADADPQRSSEESVVGQIMITTEWSDWRNGHFYWIQSVYVTPAWRRRGVYRALHQHVVDHARARGDVVGVRLYVEPDNVRAKKTYESLGMTKNYDVMEQPL